MTVSKRLFAIFLILFSFYNIYGAYLKNIPQKITQPDGTIIHCFASGDEYHNWLHDTAGYTIIQDKETGYYVYAILSAEELIASPYIVGRVNPETVGLKPYINISVQAWSAKRSAIEQMREPTRQHKAIWKNEGQMNNLAFFIAFKDDTGYSKSYSFLSEMYNDTSWGANSLYNFYRMASYEKLYINTHFFPAPNGNKVNFYRDEYPRAYFEPYSENNKDGYMTSMIATAREHALLKRVVDYFKHNISPFIDLDFNNDNRIDNICFIVTGSPGAWSSLLWPHRSWLFSDSITINDKRVYDYNFQIEESSYPGVITHEMMHSLSAPDLYRYSNDEVTPVGPWDLMASTNYSSPQGLGAYMKYMYGGWIDSIPEITAPGVYTLYPANGTSPEKTIYMIRSNSMDYTNDYLVLEYRKTSSSIFEENLPGSGLLIYRINPDFEGEGNAAYDGNEIFDEIYLFRPDGTTTQDGNVYQAHFAKNYNRTTFGMASNPHPFDHTYSAMGDILITDITEVGDSIQFTIKEQVDSLSISPNEIVLDCNGGSESQFSINSNTQWTVIFVNAPWLTINKTTGKGNSTINVRASQNTNSSERTVSIKIYPLSGNFIKEIKVRQLPCNKVEQINRNPVINIFPNPTNERLTIIYPEMNELTDIFIYSITGQLIDFSVIEREENNMTIDISKLPAGIYYIRFSSTKQSTVKSFIVK